MMRPRAIAVALICLAAFWALVRPAGAISSTQWTSIGPAPDWQFFPGGETGRATAIAINPDNAQDVWIGTAGGGVWHSSDGGGSWSPMADDQPSLAIGSIALGGCDSSHCAWIYVGTGENAIRRDTYYGAGLLVGSNGLGLGWTLQNGSPKYDFKYGNIYNVVLDPSTSGAGQVIYITLSSGVTASPSETTVTAPQPKGGYGIYKSVNNGVDWDRKFPGRPTDLEIDPKDTNTLYAGILGKGIFKSTDAGTTWCPLDPGIPLATGCSPTFNSKLPNPQQTSFDHVEIAVDPESTTMAKTHLYASFGNCPDRLLADCQPSIYESSDAGATWTLQYAGTTNPFPLDDAFPPCPGGYTRYTHALTVDPLSPGTLWLGGILLCRSTNHGASWAEKDLSVYGDPTSGSIETCSGIFANRCLSHPDHHAVVFAPGGNQVLFDANDGGIAISKNSGKSWAASTKGLSAFEFQSITSSPNTPNMIGGTQDNGGVLWQGSTQWTNLQCCGDGGAAVLEHTTTKNIYITSNEGAAASSQVLPVRSLDGGTTFFDPLLSFYDNGLKTGQARALYPPMYEDQDNLLHFGTQQLWQSADSCGNWTPQTPTLASYDPEPEIIFGADVITAAAESPTNDAHTYVGYYSGRMFKTLSQGCGGPSCFPCGTLNTFDEDGQTHPACTPLPGPVTGIAVDPTDDNKAYASVSGFFPGIHVYHTTDGGTTWKRVTGSLADLNGVPADTITLESSTGYLWLGTDNGVYRGVNGGSSWARLSDGMPRVPVYAFALDTTSGRIVAATHGRGAYMLTSSFLTQKVAGPIHKLVLDQPVLGAGFRPNQVCGMRLLRQDGSVCASGSTDALGGSMSTDAQGFLVSSRTGFFENMPYVWGCGQGKCLSSDVKACNVAGNPLSTLEVTCGAQVVTQAVPDPGQTGTGPASSTFSFRNLGPGGAGTFQLLPAVQSGDGTSRILCSVPVSFAPSDTTATILQNAVAAVAGDPSCRAAGVSAEFLSGSSGREVEDSFPLGASLHLLAPDLAGSELIAAVRSDPGSATGVCFDAARLEDTSVGVLHAMKVHFTTPPGGAGGGSLTITERSTMGDCAITVPTSAGASAASLAAAVAAVFQAGGIPGPNPGCPSDVNPRDVVANGGAIETALASEIEICSADPAVGVQVAPQEICFSDADCDDGNPCTSDVCNPITGQCQSTPVPNGQACDDQNLCTVGNTCQAGACGTPVVCGGGDLCAPNVCDPATGACVSQPKVCDDGNPCTSDACLPATGACSFAPLTGSSCDDGDLCTIGDVCTLLPGNATPICQGGPKCEDGDACTADHCDPATGACVNLPIQCDDGNPCTFDSCQNGGCVATPVADGTACDDGNLCTTGGTCQTNPFTGLAACVGTPVSCDDGDACTMDACDPTTGGCSHSPLATAEVPGVQFTSPTSMTWQSVSGASFYNTYRGTIPSSGLGSRPPAGIYDQTCFEYGDEHGDGAQVSTDTSAPPLGALFYYLVSEETPCGEGSIGSDSNGTPIPNTSPCSNPAPPRLIIMKSHSGSFLQGQTGATYTLVVPNTGTGPTFGTVTVEDMVPSGLTLVSMAGPGWTCVPGGDTCTRNDALAGGSSYPPITVTVNVAANATSPQVNQAEVSGGGSGLGSTSDSTTIIPVAPALSITKSHTGHFYRGETGATYTVTVSNTGNAPTSGTVTVVDNAPVGFTNVSMSGTGWTCPSPGASCTRSDALAPGASYPDITVTVDVAPDAPLPSLTNQVTASGGGSASASASDPTTIDYPILVMLKSHVGNFVQGQQGAVYTLRIQDQGFGPTVGTVTVTEVTPSGLTLVSMSGTGWTCPVSPGNTCTRSDSLASTAYYPDITVTVNVASNAPSSIMNEADVVGGASVGTGKAFDSTSIDTGRVVLGIVKTHAGDFVQGQQNATYTLTVSNGGNLATAGTVTVTENPPAGLTLVSMAGTGWTCPSSPGNTCTRSDALAPGGSYPDITVTVNVAVNASSPLTNQATVTGGGDGTLHTANDPTNVNPGPPVLAVTKTHNGNFSQGETGAKYTVTVSNVGSQSTVGPVDVDELPPPGLAPVSMAGTGWTCSPAHCSRSDSLPPGSSYPAITVTVNVLATATSPQVNQVNVGGGGSAPATASDSTTIIPAGVPSLTITKTHAGNFFQGQMNATYTLTVSNNIGAGTTVGPVSVDELPPSGLVPVSMAGTGWSCSPTHCTRNTALAPGASYPTITVTVNVQPGATSPQVNQASVSGGGSAPSMTSDPTVITP
jgi:uncharacterized repeat protein (TIGR01451 family)